MLSCEPKELFVIIFLSIQNALRAAFADKKLRGCVSQAAALRPKLTAAFNAAARWQIFVNFPSN